MCRLTLPPPTPPSPASLPPRAQTKAEVRVWPLNPNLFPNHPLYVKQKQSEHVLEPPFIVHYNWLYGIAAKEREMQGAGHWLIPDT